jgi:hypothetical protein
MKHIENIIILINLGVAVALQSIGEFQHGIFILLLIIALMMFWKKRDG